MDSETIRIAAGAFLTSSGFAAIVAGVAAYGAWKGITARIDADRDLAKEADKRERWWWYLTWTWENRDSVSADTTAEALLALGDESEGTLTSMQSAVLKALTDALLAEAGTVASSEVTEEGADDGE